MQIQIRKNIFTGGNLIGFVTDGDNEIADIVRSYWGDKSYRLVVRKGNDIFGYVELEMVDYQAGSWKIIGQKFVNLKSAILGVVRGRTLTNVGVAA